MRIGELLVNAGKITPAQLDETLKGQAIYGGKFGTNLVEMGYLDEYELSYFLSKKTGIPHASPEQLMEVPPHVTKLIPEETVRKHKVMPVALNNRKLTLAMVDPTNFGVIDDISFSTGFIVVPVIVPELRMVTAMEKHYSIRREMRYISVEGGSRNRNLQGKAPALAQTPPVLARVTIPTPPPAPKSEEWLAPGEAEILELELPLLEEFGFSDACDEKPSLDPLAGSTLYQKAPEKDYSLEAVTKGLADAEDRDSIADLVTGHAAQQYDRVALFLHKGGKATGWVAQVGKKPVPEFEALEIPLDGPSVLKLVDESKSFYLGPLPPTPGNALLADALGGGLPAHNLLVPLMMMGRVVAVLYVDGGKTPLDTKLPEFQKLVSKASMAFEILILKSKILMT